MNVVVYITAESKSQAESMASALVEAKLAACVNIVEGVLSIFHWEGKVDQANEVLLICKTQQKNFAEIVAKVKALHSYDVPEIIALPIVEGEANYMKWIEKST